MSGVITYFFRGLALKANIGVLAKEKAAPQTVMIDVEYDCLDKREGTDELGSVLNYDEVRAKVAEIVERRHFNLQETLCDEILASLIARPEVMRAKVSVSKPDIYADVDAVGVIMEARRS